MRVRLDIPRMYLVVVVVEAAPGCIKRGKWVR